MIKKYFLYFFAFLLYSGCVYASPVQVGVISGVKGTFEVESISGQVKSLKVGDPIYLNDVVRTEEASFLQVLLLDETVFSIGENSAIMIDEFVYDPASDDGKLNASILKGVFRFVSGRIAHNEPKNMNVDLPAGSIGIHGTVVAGIVDGSRSLIVLLGPPEGQGVRAGRITVRNLVDGSLVEVEVDEMGYGTIVGGENTAPLKMFKVGSEDLQKIEKMIIPPPTGGGENTDPLGPGSFGGVTQLPTDTISQIMDALSDSIDETFQQAQDQQDQANQSSGSSSSGHQSPPEPPKVDEETRYELNAEI